MDTETDALVYLERQSSKLVMVIRIIIMTITMIMEVNFIILTKLIRTIIMNEKTQMSSIIRIIKVCLERFVIKCKREIISNILRMHDRYFKVTINESTLQCISITLYDIIDVLFGTNLTEDSIINILLDKGFNNGKNNEYDQAYKQYSTEQDDIEKLTGNEDDIKVNCKSIYMYEEYIIIKSITTDDNKEPFNKKRSNILLNRKNKVISQNICILCMKLFIKSKDKIGSCEVMLIFKRSSSIESIYEECRELGVRGMISEYDEMMSYAVHTKTGMDEVEVLETLEEVMTKTTTQGVERNEIKAGDDLIFMMRDNDKKLECKNVEKHGVLHRVIVITDRDDGVIERNVLVTTSDAAYLYIVIDNENIEIIGDQKLSNSVILYLITTTESKRDMNDNVDLGKIYKLEEYDD